MVEPDRMVSLTEEECAEIIALCESAIDVHPETVLSLTQDDSTDTGEFRRCIADEYHRHKIRIRLVAMLKGGEG